MLYHFFSRLFVLSVLLGGFITLPARAADSPHFCVAVQGNGQAIFGHFHSLAKLVSYFGLPGVISGSSSGSITSFLYESMLKNPVIQNCNEKEKQHRVSLMLKSLVGFFEMSETRQESDALIQYVSGLKDLANRWKGGATPGLRLEDIQANEFDRIHDVLKVLYNERFAQLILQPSLAARQYHFDDYKAALGAPFEVSDQTDARVFLRPFPVSFTGIAKVFGWIGNFYAGGPRYHNQSHWIEWFNSCGDLEKLKDKTWGEIAFGESYTLRENIDTFVKGRRTPTACEKGFRKLIADYNHHDNSIESGPDDLEQDRIQEAVGKYLPAMPITGLFIGSGAEKVKKAKKIYWSGKTPKLDIDYKNEFRLGYYGTDALLKKIEKKIDTLRNENGEIEDINLSNFKGLRNFSWKTVLETSPAEPTIAEAKEITEDMTSNGGWVGGFPATVLKLAGCEHVAFIASERKNKNFALVSELTRLSGGQDYIEKILSTTENPRWGKSSLIRGLEDADGVWCTKWDFATDYLSLTGVYQMSEDTFNLDLETKDDFFRHRASFAKPAMTGRYGCNLL